MGGGEKALDESALAGTEEAEAMFAQRGCCFFWVPHFGGESSAPAAARGVGAWERIGDATRDAGGATTTTVPLASPWWRRALMKVREWSEIVAGPRWKTLIRRFNRSRRWCGGARPGKFHYDPMSYALNFDDGRGGGRGSAAGNDAEDEGYPNFSARFVLPPSLGKTSMDHGGRNAPALFSSG